MPRWLRRSWSIVRARGVRTSAVAALLGAVWAASAATGATPATAAAALAQAPSGIAITEVRAQAGRGQQEAAFEWVEIHNAGAAPVDLTGWRLADNGAADPVPATTLPPGGYLIVGGGAELAAELPAGVTLVVVEDGRIGNGLANGGDRVVLIDPVGAIVDGVSWGSDQSSTTLAPPPRGQTLSRGAGGWTAAPPSPGGSHAAESAPPSDEAAPEPEPEPADSPAEEAPSPSRLRVTEIFASAGQGSRDAAFEWVEVHNGGTEPIDLTGWTIADNVAVDVLQGGVVAPGGYVTIGGSAEAAGGAVDIALEDGRIGNGLANGGDVVTLRDPQGRLADEVAYGQGSVPLPEVGRSIALRGDGWVVNAAPSPGSGDVTPPAPSREDKPEPSQQPAEEQPTVQQQQQAPPGPPPPLRITEIFASAGEGSRDAAFEWVEVHNAGSEPIDLTGWTIADNVAADVLPGGVVAPGAYVTIGGSPEAAGGSADVALEDGRIGNGLANGGDVVTLRDPWERLVDEVAYGTASAPLPEVGRSIALSEAGWVINAAPSPGSGEVTPPPPAEEPPTALEESADEEAAAADDADAADVATAAVDDTPPGDEAAVQDGERASAGPLPPLRITEIFASAGEGSRDAAFEWVEVHNYGAEPIDLSGWTIADAAAEDRLAGGVVAPGAYVTIGGSPEAAGGAVDVVLEDGRIGNGLANGGDSVVLLDPHGRIVGGVAYGTASVPLPEEGRSIALTDDGWVVNAVPSPGSDAVTPLLESLEDDEKPPNGVADNDGEAQDEGGIPAWLLVVVAVAVPLAALTGRMALRRLRRPHGGGRR